MNLLKLNSNKTEVMPIGSKSTLSKHHHRWTGKPSVNTTLHSLKHLYTAVSGDTDFPEFTVVGLLDDHQFVYFDSNTKTLVLTTEWMKEKNLYGCEWHDETELQDYFHHYGYDAPPSVSLLQKTPSSPVTCHATGFYPSGVTVFWQKDGQEQHEDVLHGEILPNDDGTFQKSAHLTMDSEWENNNYTCVVEHKENIIAIRLGQSPPESGPIIIGVVVAVILPALIAIAGFIMWNRKWTGEKQRKEDLY
ncbi:major histocompatibility complex class I-related gene protein-like [Salvelinus alpinus]|uniref:major histocompatibility complex class I-related gene protein-like n=1 Tax=Salvelinus alpinus TaxID=8036 RepID=UPI0039FC47DA